MMPERQARINIRSVTNAATRKELRNGREVIIVPSATLPDDVIMNNIKYTADEIEKSYKSLERTPAPVGHPVINKQFVSALDPEGINLGYIGAWNENVRRSNGRVFLDKVIDVEVANRSSDGKAVLKAIEAKEPIHTSTGLLCNLEAVTNEADYKFLARNIHFDHDAILLNDKGAATPEQGVGMLVNGQSVEVINSALDSADCQLDWAGMDLVRAIEGLQRASMWEKIKAAVLSAMGVQDTTVTNATGKDETMPNDPAFEALNKQVTDLAGAFTKLVTDLPTIIGNAVKPLTDNMTAIQNAQIEAAKVEKASLVAKVVKANILTEVEAGELTVGALKMLANKIADPVGAAALNSGFTGVVNATNEFAAYDPNKEIDAAVKGSK